MRAHIYSNRRKVSYHFIRLAFPHPSSSVHPIMELHMSTQKREDLNNLVGIFNGSLWLHGGTHEPRIGDPDTPEVAEVYGLHGRSCFIVYVHERGNGPYRRCHESCFRPIERGGDSTRLREGASYSPPTLVPFPSSAFSVCLCQWYSLVSRYSHVCSIETNVCSHQREEVLFTGRPGS